ncbi:Bcgst8 [Botrytis cinerea B05.10]|uniref:Bcgst8 n=3 Tax=Botryotinia fuckeliana TaxID=40559 RepID=A0A384J860_BOTFB|nr:Bcgst8 [Botrytis cinerea B05.10]ATZ46713.1 Bcgst8 [Botrytis cinerea B05.10]EMR84848.1 putative glutathione transferase omega-1 protein [Botrytis cinerea BcDW1]CCD48392.1 similar to glutathione transferase omega-1 [Botrytis cinerea T4]
MSAVHPDANLFPHATGLAAEMVKQYSKEEPVKLYAGWFCPFTQRVLLLLLEKRIPFQYIEVNPYQKPLSLLKLNPRGLIPTLSYEGKALYESTIICEFLEDAYPSHYPRLLTREPFERARLKIWTDHITSRVVPAFNRFLQYQSVSLKDPRVLAIRNKFLTSLYEFTQEMHPIGPYFTGKEPCIVDYVLAPWALRIWIFDYFKGGLHIEELGELTGRWKKWLEAIEKRKSIQMTLSATEYYLPIYERYADSVPYVKIEKSREEEDGVF